MLREQIADRAATEKQGSEPGLQLETRDDLDLSSFDPTVNVQPELFG